MEKYFITPEKLAEVNILLADFLAAIPQKRVANSVSKVSTLNIGEIFNTVTKMLKQETDVLMLLFAETEPDFYNAYKNARIIRAGEKLSLKKAYRLSSLANLL